MSVDSSGASCLDPCNVPIAPELDYETTCKTGCVGGTATLDGCPECNTNMAELPLMTV